MSNNEQQQSLQQRIDQLLSTYDKIEKDIASLKQAISQRATQQSTPQQLVFRNPNLGSWEHDTEDVVRVKEACKKLQLASAQFHKVPTNYYDFPLEGRREILQAPSIHHLCKSMIIENTHCVNEDCSDRKNARFYCIVMQYTSKLSTDKIMKYLRELNENKLGKRKFYFRLAYAEEQVKLTGYKFNAVAPVGMTVDIPIIVSDRIVNTLTPCKVYLGGGEVDIKLEVDVNEFIRATNAFVADVTDIDPDAANKSGVDE